MRSCRGWGRLPGFPCFLRLMASVVLAGGSAAAAWKAELLSASGAHVEVYAVDACDELLQLAADPPRGAIVLIRRAWTAEDFKGAVVAVGAFEDDEGAARFSSAARTVGVPVNVIDKPAFCDFSFGAIVNRSPLVIGISPTALLPCLRKRSVPSSRRCYPTVLPLGRLPLHAGAAR